MNIGLGFLVEVVAFVAAAYVVVALRHRLTQLTTDLVLASIGCVMGAGALLFQQDVSLAGGVLAPPFAAFLLVAHVRAWDAVGVTLPRWVNIPPLGRRQAYASGPAESGTIEEPMQRPTIHDAARAGSRGFDPEPAGGFDPEPLPGEEELAPPVEPLPPEHAWPSTIIRAPAQTRLPRSGVRRTRVEVRRVGPLSVLKFSLIFYFCVFLVIYLAARDHLGDLVRERSDRLAGGAPRHDLPVRRAASSPTKQISTGRRAADRDRHRAGLHVAVLRRMRRSRDLVAHQRVRGGDVQPDQRHRRRGGGHARRPS